MPACPECSGRVTAYAAGCEHCGADLDAWRRRTPVAEAEPARSITLPRVSWVAVGLFAGTLFAVLWITVLGLGLALFGVAHGHFERQPRVMVAYGALAVLAAALEIARL